MDTIPAPPDSGNRRYYECFDNSWDVVPASDYILWAGDLPPGSRVVLWCRVSKRGDRDSLARQRADLERRAAEHGFEVVEVIEKDGVKGYSTDGPEFYSAVCAAMRHNAVIVAFSTDRLIRAAGFRPNHPVRRNLQPCRRDFGRLRGDADGVPLATFLDPDALPETTAGESRARGQRESGNRGGRPTAKEAGFMKRRKAELLPRVLQLAEAGYGPRAVARLTGVPRSTVDRWLGERDGEWAP